MPRSLSSCQRRALAFALVALAACRRDAPSSPPAPAAPAAPPVAAAVRVDAGGAAPAIACPPEMAPIPGFGCIDRYEASIDPVATDGGAGPSLGGKDGAGTTVVARSRAGVYPLTHVTVGQAKKACENAGKHLCAEREWVAACRGPERWQYPYGNTFEPKRCNDWNIIPYGPHAAAKTGSYPRCVTPAGVYDLANNVGEWMAERSRVGPVHEIRGGTYNMTIHDSSCDEDDYAAAPDAQQPDVGFRCCR